VDVCVDLISRRYAIAAAARYFYFGMFSANGASLFEAWGIVQGIQITPQQALQARFNAAPKWKSCEIETRFQRWPFPLSSRPWDAVPGCG
jgi:hypothetical protein